MWVKEYRKCSDIDVEFENGYISKNRTYQQFKKGSIKNLYYPNIYNVGYIGFGKYNWKNNKKIYKVWCHMLERCYDEKYIKKQPTYENCEICKEWHNFQNFAKWYEENYYEVADEKMCLDKDILFKGNKIYSPDTCIFVPNRINILFIKANNLRGEYPIGVSWDKKQKKFTSQCCIMKKYKKIGRFNTPEEAFKAYKEFKESYIKQVADEYKDKIPEKLYNAMYKWEVEIDD